MKSSANLYLMLDSKKKKWADASDLEERYCWDQNSMWLSNFTYNVVGDIMVTT